MKITLIREEKETRSRYEHIDMQYSIGIQALHYQIADVYRGEELSLCLLGFIRGKSHEQVAERVIPICILLCLPVHDLNPFGKHFPERPVLLAFDLQLCKGGASGEKP